MNIILRWIVNAVAIMLTAYLLPGVYLSGFGAALAVALVLGLLNVFLKPLFVLFTLPVTVLTFGLFLFVINAVLILLTDALVSGFAVSGFWVALLFSLILSIILSVFQSLDRSGVGSGVRV